MKVRPALPDDLETLCRLEANAFTGDRLSRARFRHWIGAANGCLLVAVGDGRVSGYGLAIYRRDSRSCRVYSLAVDPEARGRGVASALMAALETDARGRGCKEMRLEVASKNTGATSLYERLGYTQFGRKPDYYEDGDTALRMRKPVASRR